jgi:transcriptional regulator with XRE-family HTH domain
MARKVPEDERIIISHRIRNLLFDRDESGKRKWTQASLGAAFGVSQQTILRSMQNADGVTAAVRDGLLKLLGKTGDELISQHSYILDDLRRADPSRRQRLRSEAHDRAVEILVRNDRELEQASDAVGAVQSYKWREGEPNPEHWARLAEALIITDQAIARNAPAVFVRVDGVIMTEAEAEALRAAPEVPKRGKRARKAG